MSDKASYYTYAVCYASIVCATSYASTVYANSYASIVYCMSKTLY
jgi:hypothetical protein